MSLPAEDRNYRSLNEMKEDIIVLLGGRVAEAIILGDISTGASNDIERATKLATDMVTRYGMSEKLGPICYGSSNNEVFIGRDMGHVKNYSEETASEIDEEVHSIILTGYHKTESILREHIDKLHRVAKFLFDHEKMSAEEFMEVMEHDHEALESGVDGQQVLPEGQKNEEQIPQKDDTSSEG